MTRVVLAGTGMVRIPPVRGGAIEAHLLDLYTILQEQQFPVTLISDVRPGFNPGGGTVVPVGSPVDQFPLAPFASSLAHLVGGYLTARACIRYLDRHPSDGPFVLHLNEEISASLITHAARFPVVFTVHNPPVEPGIAPLGPLERALRSVGSALTRRFVARHASLVIVPNPALRERLIIEWGLEEDRVVMLPLPIDTRLYAPGHRSRECSDLLYVGRLDGRKNVLELVRLMERLDSGVRLTLVGDGPLRDSLNRVVRRRNWAQRVRLLPRVGLHRLVQLYRSSSAFVFPSRLESFGRAILEAAACGLPVVLPKLPVYRDFIEHGFTVPYTNVAGDRLQDAVERLRSEDGWRQVLGRRAREYVVRNNSYPVFANRLIGTYLRAGE
jgi:glycosyltransferase involved in cell wall biosynthesis